MIVYILTQEYRECLFLLFAANNGNREMYSTAVLLLSVHIYIAVFLSSIPAITTVQNREIYA